MKLFRSLLTLNAKEESRGIQKFSGEENWDRLLSFLAFIYISGTKSCALVMTTPCQFLQNSAEVEFQPPTDSRTLGWHGGIFWTCDQCSCLPTLSIMVEQPGGPYDVISGWNEGRSSACCVPSLERLSSA